MNIKDLKTHCVYKIINLINGKLYIGKSYDSKTRWSGHLTQARNGYYGDGRYQAIHSAMNKYGFENFKMEILVNGLTEEESSQLEIEYIAKYNTFKGPGYNCTAGGDGACGYKHTKESKKLMSKLKKEAYKGKGNPFYGKKHSQETKDKMSELAKKRGVSGSNNPFYGKKHSKESIQKMKENYYQKKRYFSFERSEEIRKFYYDKKTTYKDLAKMFDTNISMIKNIIRCKRGYASDKSVTKFPYKGNKSRCGGHNKKLISNCPINHIEPAA